MRIELAVTMPYPVDLAWAALTVPALTRSWSEATISTLALGDGGHPGGTGALRRVHLPGRVPVDLREVIEDGDGPHHLRYRVISGAPVRSHQGDITLVEVAAGTEVQWTVRVEPLVRGTGALMARLIRPALERSVRRLATIRIDRADVPPAPPVRAVDDDPATLGSLRAALDDIAAAQGALADALGAVGDGNAAFARVYQYTTLAIADAVDVGGFRHPGWVLRLVPVFHRYYQQALDARAAGAATIESHWRRAMAGASAAAAAADRGERSRFEAGMIGIWLGMRAHIEDDLPRTLATVWADGYRGRCDYARFRADYLRLGAVFPRAAARMVDTFPRHTWSPRARVLDAVTLEVLRDRLIDRSVYPITRQRARAFERGGMIAEMLAR